MIKHATVGAFVFCRINGRWHIGLINHPRLGRLMPPGGHVEPWETPEEAVRRELVEETGLQRFYVRSMPHQPIPHGFPMATHRPMATPWWIVEEPVGPDSHLDEEHVHIDHHFAVVSSGTGLSGGSGEHPFSWHTSEQVAGFGPEVMFPDFRLLALQLFAHSFMWSGVMV
jgi:8-oxo-dGTP pyrophosphatase MutT (NUDIX family)